MRSSIDSLPIEEVIAAAPDGIISFGQDGDIVFANRHVERLLGYTPDELLDHSIDLIAMENREETLFEALRSPERAEDALRGRRAIDLRLEHKDGHEVPVSVTVEAAHYEDQRFFIATLRDVSERREREYDHQEAQELFGKVCEHSNDAIFIFDPDADAIKDVNPRACELLGYDREELLAMGPSDIHPHQVDTLRAFVEEVLDEGDGRTSELSCVTSDDEVVPAETSMSRIMIDNDPHILASVRDVSERKEHERRLEALNEANRELMNAGTGQAIADIAVDIVHRVLDRSFTALWKAPADADKEILRPLAASEGVTALIDADDPPDTLPPIRAGTVEMEIFREGEPRLLEDYETIQHRAHPELPLATRLVVPLDGHGVLAVGTTDDEEIDSTMRDLVAIVAQSTCTAYNRLDREQALRHRSTAMDKANDGIAILDEEGRYVYVNQVQADLYGLDDPEELLGESWQRLYDDEETERFKREILPTVWEQGHWRGEAVGTRADGTTFPQEVSLASLEDGGLVCVVRDITERKEHEERLEALNAATQDLTQAETAVEVARTGLQAVERILGFDVGCVRLFDADANEFDPVALTDAAEELVDSRPAFDLEKTVAGRAYRQKTVVRNAGDEADSVDETPTEASLHLPLGDHGVLTIIAQDAERFDDLEISLLEALAASVRAVLDRAGREETLRENERELREQHEQLDTLLRITTLVQEIGDHLTEAKSRADLERTICEHVVASDLYRSAWIARVGVTGETVDVRQGAEVEDSYLDALDEMPLSKLGNGTVERTLETGDVQVVRRYQTTGTESEPDAAEREGRVEATAAIPLAYGDRIHGVLVVNGVREDVFSENALGALESLGRLVGFTLNALRNRELLLSDAVVELELTVVDPSLFYSTVSDVLDCRCEFTHSIPVEEGKIIDFHLIEGADPERVLQLAADAEQVEDAQVLAEQNGGFVLKAVVEPSLGQLALEAGGVIQSVVFEDGEAQVTLETSQSLDLREVVNVFDDALANVDLVAKRERERAVRTVAEFRQHVEEQLTEKQRAALEAAYAAGYYDWPREITAEELAETIGVSSSTLHQHLRKSEKCLTAAFFQDLQEAH